MAARTNASYVARGPSAPMPAAFLPRFAAYLIDAVVVCGIVFFTMTFEIVVGLEDDSNDEAGPVHSATFWATPVFWFAYQWACNAIGWSLGKLVMSLRTVESLPQVPGLEDTPLRSRPGAGRGFVRTLGQALGIVPLGLGFWWALWDEDGRTWHDRMAGTRVVRQPGTGAHKISASQGIDLRAGDVSARRQVTVEAEVAAVPEGPCFIYRPHWSKLLFWLFVGSALWGGLAALIIFRMEVWEYLNQAAEENEDDGEGSAGLVIAPLIFAALALASPFGVINYFRRHSVQLTPSELRFQAPFNFGADEIPYATIDRVRMTPLGGVEVRFTGKDFLEDDPSNQRRTLYLSDREPFLIDLRTSFEAATGKGLEVVR